MIFLLHDLLTYTPLGFIVSDLIISFMFERCVFDCQCTTSTTHHHLQLSQFKPPTPNQTPQPSGPPHHPLLDLYSSLSITCQSYSFYTSSLALNYHPTINFRKLSRHLYPALPNNPQLSPRYRCCLKPNSQPSSSLFFFGQRPRSGDNYKLTDFTFQVHFLSLSLLDLRT